MSTHDSEPQSPPPVDTEIARGPILKTGAILAAVTVAALIVMALLLHGLERGARKSAPPPPPLQREIQAAAAQGPPGPLLQANPTADMAAMRREEDQLLSTYGWVDRQQGVVRVPIDRAIDLVLEAGLPQQPRGEGASAAPASGKP